MNYLLTSYQGIKKGILKNDSSIGELTHLSRYAPAIGISSTSHYNSFLSRNESITELNFGC